MHLKTKSVILNSLDQAKKIQKLLEKEQTGILPNCQKYTWQYTTAYSPVKSKQCKKYDEELNILSA